MSSTGRDGLHELLPWFMTGTLDAEEAEAFAAHLLDCPSCREEQALLARAAAELETHGGDLLADHPDPERLVAGVRGALEPADAESFRRHLALCTACALEARWIRGDAIVPDRVGSASPSLRGWRSPYWAWAAAAASIALAGFFATRSALGPSTSGVVRGSFLAATQLTEGSVVVVKPDRHGVRLVVQADAASGDSPLIVEILDARGRVVARETDIGPDDLLEQQYLMIDCDRRDCVAGSYEIRVQSANGSAPPLRFRFDVE